MKIIFLSPWFPYPPDNGIRIRLYNLLRVLGRQNEIHLLSFVRAGDQPSFEGLRELCATIQTTPWHEFHPTRFKALAGFFSPIPRSLVDTFSPEMAQRVQEASAKGPFDAIIASTIDVARYALRTHARVRLIEEHNSMTRWMLDHYRDQRRQTARLRAWLTFWKHRRYEARMYARFDACTMVSDLDARAVRDLLDYRKPLAVIPNGVDLTYYRAVFEPVPNTLIFNGSLTYTANRDAMEFLAHEIWPHIRAQVPNATLRITGRVNGVSRSIVGDGITLTGYLGDIRPVVGQAWACIVPLRTGGGTRLKILEAMALGTPVVATSKGAEGLDVVHGENILLADSPAEFAAQTLALLRDIDLRTRLARNARQLVDLRYTWERSGKLFEEFLNVQMSRADRMSDLASQDKRANLC